MPSLVGSEMCIRDRQNSGGCTLNTTVACPTGRHFWVLVLSRSEPLARATTPILCNHGVLRLADRSLAEAAPAFLCWYKGGVFPAAVRSSLDLASVATPPPLRVYLYRKLVYTPLSPHPIARVHWYMVYRNFLQYALNEVPIDRTSPELQVHVLLLFRTPTDD